MRDYKKFALKLIFLCFVFSGQLYSQKISAEIISSKIICSEADRYIGWPTVILTQEKELVAVFSGDRDYHVCPWGKTQMIKSTDMGETWSEPVTINNTPLDDRDAGILQTSKGTLLVTWFTSKFFIYACEEKDDRWPVETWERHIEKISAETQKKWLGNWVRRSEDGGRTWGEYIPTIVNAPHGPVQLADGRLLYLGINQIIGDKKSENPPDQQRMAAAESVDDGLTWNIIGYIPVPEGMENDAKGCHELHVAECKDGKIVAMIRKHGEPGDRYLWQSESSDGGKTWTMAHQTEIWGFPPHLLCLNDGRLLVTYGRRKEPFSERACISSDGGETWDVENELTISNAANSDLGYPASVQLDDGSIYTVFYQAPADGQKTCLMGTHWRIVEN